MQQSSQQTKQGLRSQAIHGVKWTAIKTWSSQGISMAVLLVMARLLDPAEFGLFAIGHIIVILLSSIADQGLSQSLIQRKDIVPAHHYTVFWVTSGVSLLLATGLYIFRYPIASVFEAALLVELLPALAIIQVLNSMASVANSLLVRKLDFRSGAIITMVAAFSGAIVAIVLGIQGYGVWSLVGQHGTGAIINLILSCFMARWYPKCIFSWPHLTEIWQFGFFTMTGNIIAQLNQRVASLLIGAFLGVQAVGFFSVGKRVVQMGTQTLTATIGHVAMPTFSKMQAEPERLQTAFMNAVQSLAAISFPVFALTAVFATEITHIFLGAKWAPGSDVLMFLSVAAMIGSLQWLNGSLMMAKGRADLRMKFAFLNFLGNIVVFFLVYSYGIVAVAAGFAVKAYLFVPLSIYMLKKVVSITYIQYFILLQPAFSAVLLASLAALFIKFQYAFQFHDAAVVGVGGSAALIVYGLTLRMLNPELVDRLFGYVKEMMGKS